MRRMSIVSWLWFAAWCPWPSSALLEAAVVNGRVVDSAGRPVAGAEVRVWQKLPAPDGPGAADLPVRFGGSDALRTDAEGRFTTPDALVGEAFARIVAETDGMLAGRSGWIEVGNNAPAAVPDIVLTKLRAVTGQVHDRQGRPIAGVTVLNSGDGHQRVEAKTGRNGKFFLEDVPEGAVFLFAEKPDYRFTGMHLPTGQNDAAFTLAAVDETVEPITSSPPLLSDEEETALARKVLDPWLDEVAKSGTDAFSPLFALADFDPVAAHNRAGEMFIAQPKTRHFLEGKILVKCVERRDLLPWDDLRTIIEAAEDPSWKSRAYAWAAQRMDATEEPLRREWLAQALLQARRIEEPAERCQTLVVVATGLFDAGDETQAAEVMSEAEKIAEQLPLVGQESQQAFRLLALQLAKREPARAMAWLEKIKDDHAYVNFGGDLAVKLLPDHPAAAEEMWNRTADRMQGGRGPFHMGQRAVQLADFCYRMVSVDRPRAERMARDAPLQPLRVRALGAIALGLFESEPVAARELLDAIVRDELSLPVAADDLGPFGSDFLAASLTAAWLLPIAERINAQLGGECVLRSLALRPPRPGRDHLDDEDSITDINLTMMVNRYDRDLARALLAPLVARLPELVGPSVTGLDSRHALAVSMRTETEVCIILAAAIHIDPRSAVDLFDRLRQGEGATARRFQTRLRSAWVTTLSDHGVKRWETEGGLLLGYSANFWKPKHESPARAP